MVGTAVRQHGYVEFQGEGQQEGDWRFFRARGKTFLVEWFDAARPKAILERLSADETIVVFPKTGGSIEAEGSTTAVPDRAIAIVPAGAFKISVSDEQTVLLLSPIRTGGSHVPAFNERDFDDSRPEGTQALAAATSVRRRLQIIAVDDIVPPTDKPRLKIIRSEAMSVSWIEYEGLRDRSKLSPHDHPDFEQGSLAIEGAFIHHLRVPWGADATNWRDDLHLKAAPRSLCIIPPRMIHTTEGEGDGKHVLLDIFAPARADFVSQGWVFNQAEYGTEK